MFCKECGKEIDNDSKFCSHCGTKQSIIASAEKTSDIHTKPEPASQKIDISLSFGKSAKQEFKEPVHIEKYDNSYGGDIGATIFGSILILINLIVLLTVRIDDPYNLQVYKAIAAFVNIIWRIIATIWVVNIAKKQNRNHIGWGFFAFFIPNLALIIIGLLKKLKMDSTSQRDENATITNQASVSVSNDYKPSTYTEKEALKRSGFFEEGIQYEYVIEFSNGNTGSIYRLGKNVYLFYQEKNKIKVHYSNKESAIIGLDYYLQTLKIYETDRLKGNILYYP